MRRPCTQFDITFGVENLNQILHICYCSTGYYSKLSQLCTKRSFELQVEAGVGAMNKGDCFILDCRDKIFVYMGPSSRRMERLKAIHAGNAVRDDDHAGKSKVIIIGESSHPNSFNKYCLLMVLMKLYAAWGMGSWDGELSFNLTWITLFEMAGLKFHAVGSMGSWDDGLSFLCACRIGLDCVI